MAEIDGFDLDRSTAQAWAEFQSRLSEVISMIDDSGDLTIGAARVLAAAAPYVRFSSPRRDVVRCEIPGDDQLDPRFRLHGDHEPQLLASGWRTGPIAGGDQGFWMEDVQEHSDAIARRAVDALRDVYGVKHPVFLAPDQLAEVLQPAPAPVEPAVGGSARDSTTNPPPAAEQDLVAHARGSDDRQEQPPAARKEGQPQSDALVPRSRPHLDRLVDAELTHLLGYPPIRDAEGDVALRVGSTMLFLRTSADGQEVIIFAAVVHDVGGRSRAAEVLNDLNVEARWVKFQLVRDRVFVTMSVQATPFVPAHLRQALRIVSEVADGIDDELAVKLNGRTTFSEHGEA